MKWWSGIESGIRFSTASNASEARKILTTCWQRVFSSSRVCSISIRPKTKVYSTRSEDNERGSFKWCRWKFHRIMRMNIMVASRFFWNFNAEHIKQLISYMKWLLLVYYTLISTDTSSKVCKNAWKLSYRINWPHTLLYQGLWQSSFKGMWRMKSTAWLSESDWILM